MERSFFRTENNVTYRTEKNGVPNPDSIYLLNRTKAHINITKFTVILSSKERLECHKPECNIFEPTRIQMPKFKEVAGLWEKPVIKFKNFERKFKAPVVIYADFETFVKPTGNIHDNSESNDVLQGFLFRWKPEHKQNPNHKDSLFLFNLFFLFL